MAFAAEQYQGLRLTIERLGRRGQAQVIAVSSAAAGDGKTLTAVNLAGALARGSEARVLIVDADLRRPSVGSTLGLLDPHVNGLADAVVDETLDLATIARRIEGLTLWAVPAGDPRVHIHRILRAPRLELLLRDARQRFDYIVVDTPPLLPVFDSALLSQIVDGLLVVVAANQTPRKLLGEALNLVDPAKVLGIVFNRDNRPLFGYYDEYYREYFPETSGVATGA
jgi:capsular exopolysaccharide synthesis family protein